jgi:hypothetical protein
VTDLSFAEFMAARWAPLYRTAYLLSGGPGASSPPTNSPTRATPAASTCAPTTSRCVRRLPPRMRATLVLRYLEDLTEEATARELTVPPPDAALFQHRVVRARRRRTVARSAAAAVCVALVAGASALTLGAERPASAPATGRVSDAAAPVAVVVRGHLRLLDGGVLGPEGPAADVLVGTTADGTFVLTADGVLERVTGDRVERVVPRRVRTAYLDGDALVYQTEDGQIRWRGVEPVLQPRDSARTAEGRLLGAGDESAVIAGEQVVLHDPTGLHPLVLPPDTQTVSQVEIGGGVVAVRTDRGDVLLTDHGRSSRTLPGDRYAALAPDGHAYARASATRDAVELIDPTTLATRAVAGPSGTVAGLRWADDDLLVVVADAGSRTLWRCAGGTACAVVLEDPTGTLRLR